MTNSRNSPLRVASRMQAFPWRYLVWSAALFPIATVLHELGHYVTAVQLGFPAELHFASVSGIPEVSPFGGRPHHVAAVALAGPAATLLLMGIGAVYRSQGWGLALVAVGAPRFAINVVFLFQQTLVAAGVAEPAQPRFDEFIAANALGWPAALLSSIGALALFAAIAFLYRCAGIVGLVSLAFGTFIGIVAWMQVLGPILLS